MQKKFIQNLALLLTLNLLIKPFWILGIDRAVQQTVGTEAYGMYFAIFNFSFLLNILLDFGITNFNNKNIAQNNHLINKHFSSILALKLLLGIVFMVVTLAAGFLIGYSPQQLGLLAMLGFNQFLAFMILYMRSNLAGLHLFKTDSIISVLDRSLMILFCSILLWGHVTEGPFQIEWFIYTQTFSYLLTTLITFFIVVRKAAFKRLKWNRPFFFLILKKSFPFAILVLLMTFYNRVDTVMLERILPEGATESGIYASAYRLLDSANMISFLFAGLLLPMFARMLRYKESVEQLVKLAFTILLTPAIVITIGCIFYNEELMVLMCKEHALESAQVFSILMGCFIASSLSYIFGTLLTANGNLLQLNIMAASGMVFNLTLNYILIPHFKAQGAALSSLITQFVTALLQIYLAQRIFKFKVNTRLMVQLSIFIPCVVILAWVSQTLFQNWILGMVVFSGSSAAFAFSIGLLHVKSIFRILKYG
ncbi:MAG TPA: oligosaccharide flippase family protein [Flavobacteriales bacterium]|mgnify:CR=1 FL=1|nr:oligosaccharide flippase family protein [Flavobacteriales bacterium]HPH82231.1 oligosaccharide flippase family protein [Flavobacteriales bacterium]